MDPSADKRAATVLKTVETRKLWVRGGSTSAIRHSNSGTREKVNPPGLGPGDNPERYRGARPFLFRDGITVVRPPVKRKGLGANPSLGATFVREVEQHRH